MKDVLIIPMRGSAKGIVAKIHKISVQSNRLDGGYSRWIPEELIKNSSPRPLSNNPHLKKNITDFINKLGGLLFLTEKRKVLEMRSFRREDHADNWERYE